MSMNISQVKKLRKIVRIKKISNKKQQDLCLHNEEDISSLQDGTNYYNLPFFIPLPHFQYREDIYAHPCFQAFPKQFTDDYLSNHLYGQEARKVFIQHPQFNIEVFLKRTKDGRSIIHRHWPKVAKTFNMNEG